MESLMGSLQQMEEQAMYLHEIRKEDYQTGKEEAKS
jgi:hypothetical protein